VSGTGVDAAGRRSTMPPGGWALRGGPAESPPRPVGSASVALAF
jgi:hypothetical protein